MDRDKKKTKFDFETTLRIYNEGVGRKYIFSELVVITKP